MGAAKKYNRDFFKKWTREMAYVLGFICADGNIVETARGNHYIALYSSDKSLLSAIRDVFQSEHKISQRNTRSGRVFRIQVGSTVWFSDLQKLRIFPNKALRMQLPDIPKKYLGDFVRGYFDGDGNVWMGEIHKDRYTQHITLQVAFTSASQPFLESLHKVLAKGGVQGGSLHVSKKRNFSRLSFSAHAALKLYKIMYNVPHKLFLERKKIVFERFIKCGRGVAG